jgi:hypothetical protein
VQTSWLLLTSLTREPTLDSQRRQDEGIFGDEAMVLIDYGLYIPHFYSAAAPAWISVPQQSRKKAWRLFETRKNQIMIH